MTDPGRPVIGATSRKRIGSRSEDFFPGHRVFRIEPALKLPSFSEVEDADNPRLQVNFTALHTHDAESTQVLVITEYVVLSEPEPLCEKLTKDPRLISTRVV